MKKTPLLALALGLTLVSGAAQANPEAKGEIFAADLLARVKVTPFETPRTAVPADTLVIYFNPSRDSRAEVRGAAARVTEVSRTYNVLYVYHEFSNEPHAVPFFSKVNAEKALQRLVRGESIDLSNCLTDDVLDKDPRTELDGVGGDAEVCTVSDYRQKVACGLLTRVPFVLLAEVSRYESVDMVTHPLVKVKRYPCWSASHR